VIVPSPYAVVLPKLTSEPAGSSVVQTTRAPAGAGVAATPEMTGAVRSGGV
jgi:hypothetical protein